MSVDLACTDPCPEPFLSIPINLGASQSIAPSSPVVGSVLPLQRAQELISTLPGVLSVRIVPTDTGAIDEIHVLTTSEVVPKNMVRNIESALMAQLGLRINHRKVSIATTLDPVRAADLPSAVSTSPYSQPQNVTPGAIPGVASPAYVPALPAGEAQAHSAPKVESATQTPTPTSASVPHKAGITRAVTASSDTQGIGKRVLIFEDVETRRSRTRSVGVVCRVTLSRDGNEYIGEAEGHDSERSRIELAARATVNAIAEASKATPGTDRLLALEGSKLIDAFDREFVFASVMVHIGRESALLTGSCAVRESKEIAAVLAVLDATNRWMRLDR